MYNHKLSQKLVKRQLLIKTHRIYWLLTNRLHSSLIAFVVILVIFQRWNSNISKGEIIWKENSRAASHAQGCRYVLHVKYHSLLEQVKLSMTHGNYLQRNERQRKMERVKEWCWPTGRHVCEDKVRECVCLCECVQKEGGVGCSRDRWRQCDEREWKCYQATKAFGWETRRGREKEKTRRVEGHGVAK